MAKIIITTDCGKEITTFVTPTHDDNLFKLISESIMDAETKEIEMSVLNSIRVIVKGTI